MNCLKSSKLNDKISMLNKLTLEGLEKDMLSRVIIICSAIERKHKRYSMFYSLTILFTTIASILTTTFLSLNESVKQYPPLYWTTFSLSLCVSIVNALSSFYKWDRKYFLLFEISNKLEAEVWSYIELIGSYKDKGKFSTHKEKLKLFLTRIETLSNTLNKNLLSLEEKDDDKTPISSKLTPIYYQQGHHGGNVRRSYGYIQDTNLSPINPQSPRSPCSDTIVDIQQNSKKVTYRNEEEGESPKSQDSIQERRMSVYPRESTF